MSIIKSGYRITVDSSENDGDSYRTISVGGLTLDDAQFHTKLLMLLHSQSGKYGCIPVEDSDQLMEDFANECLAIIDKGKYVVKDLDMANRDDEEVFHEIVLHTVYDNILEQYIGYPEIYEGYETRQVDNIIIEYIPVEINIDEITDQFLKDL